MPPAKTNGIELEYDTFGDSRDPAVLLIMGLGTQMTAWEPEFCRLLTDRDLYVIRFDNRDVGLSTKFDGRLVDVRRAVYRALIGLPVDAPYDLSDMSADTVGLLDHLGIANAHVVGISLGGMIAQTMAIEHASRVRSLTSMASSTGNPWVGQPNAAALRMLLSAPGESRADVIEDSVEGFRVIGSPSFFDEERVRVMAAEGYDRSYYPAGGARQLVAVVASGDRTDRLRSVEAPTLVIHGRLDPLIRLPAGRRTARAIPGARLVVLDRWGHDLPPGLWPEMAGLIADHLASH